MEKKMEDYQAVIIGISVGLLAAAITYFLTKTFNQKTTISIEEHTSFKDEQSLVIAALNNDLSGFKAKHEVASVRVVELEDEVSKIENQLKENIESKSSLIAKLQAEKDSLENKISENKEELNKLQDKFKSDFENLANRIFDEKNEKFQKQSEKSITDILAPVKEQFQNFEKKVNDSFGGQAKEQFALKEEIKRIVQINEKMTFQTESLTKALKSDVKMQGNWGEVILEKILEESGLRKEHDYILQGAGMGLKYDTGSSQQPDVIVKLPDEKHIIIDAKVSLTHYEQFWASEDTKERDILAKAFTTSIKNHVKGLEARKYQDNDKLGTPDFVLMFMPVEGAYALAVQSDPDLHSFAWDKKVVIVGPSTLFATLRTISSIWKLELQNQNANEIARQGGALYDKIALFVESMTKLGGQMETASKSYNEAMNRLSTGKGNMLGKAEDLKALGLKTSKNLPKTLVKTDISELAHENGEPEAAKLDSDDEKLAG